MDDQAIEKLVQKMADIFPTAEMLNNSFQKAKENTDQQFKEVHKRFDEIEKHLVKKQNERIEKLEAQVTRIYEALALNK